MVFDIETANYHQVIEIIDETYSEESIIKDLSDGSIVTTTWHNQGTLLTENNLVEVLETGHKISVVKDQEIDGKSSEFR